jgi:hypothetical protein
MKVFRTAVLPVMSSEWRCFLGAADAEAGVVIGHVIVVAAQVGAVLGSHLRFVPTGSFVVHVASVNMKLWTSTCKIESRTYPEHLVHLY